MKELVVFEDVKLEITRFVGPIPKLKVIDFKSSAIAIDHGKTIKALLKEVEKQRDALVRPRNEEVRRINAYAAQIREPLEQAEEYLQGQLEAYELEQRKIREAEERRIEEERRARERQLEEEAAAKREELAERVSQQYHSPVFGGAEEPQDAQRAAIDIERDLEAKRAELNRETASQKLDLAYERRIRNTRYVWDCELVDINQVPAEFLIRTLNKQMVLAAARAGRIQIPGLRIFQKPSIGFGSHTGVAREALTAERDRKKLAARETPKAEPRPGRRTSAATTRSRQSRERKSSARSS